MLYATALTPEVMSEWFSLIIAGIFYAVVLVLVVVFTFKILSAAIWGEGE